MKVPSHDFSRRRVERWLARRIAFRPVRARLERPMASLTFDDAPVSAVRTGAAILEERGVRGAYYVCGAHTGGRFEGRDQHTLADLAALAAAGHELGCHTYAHINVEAASPAEMEEDRRRNAAFLDQAPLNTAGTLGQARSFAYPYGFVSFAAKRYYAGAFQTCRGVMPGVNSGRIDLAELKSNLLSAERWNEDQLLRLIDRAARERGWLTFFTHDVCGAPSPVGCRPDQLIWLTERLQAAGVEIAPVRAVARRLLADDAEAHG